MRRLLACSNMLSAPLFIFVGALPAQSQPPASDHAPPTSEQDEVWSADTLDRVIITDDTLARPPDPYDLSITAADIEEQLFLDTGSIVADIAARLGINAANVESSVVVLIDGRPVATPAEVLDLPPSAIASITIYTGAQAVRLGYSSDQYVVIVALKPNSSETLIETAGTRALWDDLSRTELAAGYFGRTRTDQLSVNARRNAVEGWTAEQTTLFEFAGTPYPKSTPRADGASLSAGYNHRLALGVWGAANLQLYDTSQERPTSLQEAGLPTPDGVADKRMRSHTSGGQLSLSLNGWLGVWRYDGALTGSFSREATTSSTVSTGATDNRISRRGSGWNTNLRFRGPLMQLPTGTVQGSVSLEDRVVVSDLDQQLAADSSHSHTRQRRRTFQADLFVPLISQTSDLASIVGPITASVGSGWNSANGRLAGTSSTLTFDWAIPTGLRLRYMQERRVLPPTTASGDGSFVRLPEVAVWDPAVDEIAEVTIISGGNPNLAPEKIDRIRIELSYARRQEPWSAFLRYENIERREFIYTFPRLTSLFEEAYPSRVTRDTAGRLVEVDLRPVNVGDLTAQTFETGVSFDSGQGAEITVPGTQAADWRIKGSISYRWLAADDVRWDALSQTFPRNSVIPADLGANANTLNLRSRLVHDDFALEATATFMTRERSPDILQLPPDTRTFRMTGIWRPTPLEGCVSLCLLTEGASVQVDVVHRTDVVLARALTTPAIPSSASAQAVQFARVDAWEAMVSYKKRF